MARDQADITCSGDEYTELTNTDVTEITFQVRAGEVEIRFTTDATRPLKNLKGIIYQVKEGERQIAIADLSYLSGAKRVWARPTVIFGYNGAIVYVDHA